MGGERGPGRRRRQHVRPDDNRARHLRSLRHGHRIRGLPDSPTPLQRACRTTRRPFHRLRSPPHSAGPLLHHGGDAHLLQLPLLLIRGAPLRRGTEARRSIGRGLLRSGYGVEVQRCAHAGRFRRGGRAPGPSQRCAGRHPHPQPRRPQARPPKAGHSRRLRSS